MRAIARAAGAANFLAQRDARIEADNTDGAGLVADLRDNLRVPLAGARILLVGAGGAARGVVAPLLAERPGALVIANRDVERAKGAGAALLRRGPHERAGASPPRRAAITTWWSTRHPHPRSASRSRSPTRSFGAGALAYDMAYGPAAAGFVARARARGARASDGLGMLVAQAAESFFLWRGRRPATAAVIAELRGSPA